MTGSTGTVAPTRRRENGFRSEVVEGQHGEDAGLEAAMRADVMLEKGTHGGREG